MKIKGLILQARRDFVIENFGEDGWTKVLKSLPQGDQDLLGGILFAAQWYPFAVGDHLDKAIVKVLGGGKQSVFEDIGAKSAQKRLAGEHKSFLSPGDPQVFMRKAPMIYRFYYDTGYREYEETGPNSGVMTTFEAETYSTPDCLTVIGWYKEALRMCGATNVKVDEVSCRARGGDYCRYRFSWRL
jgi:uncharacterized protein (TIGR02265 family)